MLKELLPLLHKACYAFAIVFGAMIVDLISGLWKAKKNGKATRSKALRQSVSKLITYEGSLFICIGTDAMLYLCEFWKFITFIDLTCTPVLTLLCGIFLCIVEFISVMENAETKLKKNMDEAVETIKKGIDTYKEIRDNKTTPITK